MALVPEFDLNSIFLGQLHKSDIVYHNTTRMMILIKSNKTIAYAKRSYNFFTLNLTMFN